MVTRLVVVAIYMVAMMAIGARLSKAKDASDYLVGGKSMPTWALIIGYMAAYIAASGVIGYAGKSYLDGVSCFWITTPWKIGSIIFGFLMAGYLGRMTCFTQPEVMGARYGRRARLISAIVLIWLYLGMIASCTLAMGNVLSVVLNIPVPLACFISVVVAVFYTYAGGFKAVVWTNVVQFVTLVAGTLIVFPIAHKAIGGFAGFSQLPPGHLDWFSAPTSKMIAWFLTGAGGGIVLQDVWRKVLGAKDANQGRLTGIVAPIIVMVWYLVPIAAGLYARVLWPNLAAPDMAFPYMVTQLLPDVLAGLALSGMIAGVMSTYDTELLAVSANISVDIYKEFFNPNCSDEQLVRVTRWCIVLVGFGSLLMLFGARSVVDLQVKWYGVMAGALTIPCLGIFYWKRAGMLAGELGLLFGALGVLVPTMMSKSPLGWDPVIWGMIASAVGMIIGAVAGEPISDEAFENLRPKGTVWWKPIPEDAPPYVPQELTR